MNFEKWLEINEGDAIYDGSGNTEDYQWWGDPKSAGYSMKKPKGAKKRKKEKPDVKTEGRDDFNLAGVPHYADSRTPAIRGPFEPQQDYETMRMRQKANKSKNRRW